jgi:hypothetical protein
MLLIETNVFKSNLHTQAYGNKGKMQTQLEIKEVLKEFSPLLCTRNHSKIKYGILFDQGPKESDAF